MGLEAARQKLIRARKEFERELSFTTLLIEELVTLHINPAKRITAHLFTVAVLTSSK